jgi:3-oxoacyl-[acyl-carrier protein] reductase
MSEPFDPRSIAGKVALVTGAASGMGRATAELFAAEGAKVAVTDYDEAGANDVAAAISASGGMADAWRFDVGDPDAVKAVVAEVAERFGGLDIIVNNAGIGAMARLDDDQYDERWGSMLDVLLTSHQRIVRAALPWLRQSAAPRIVNIASTDALGATGFNSPYVAAKTGVVGLTRALAVDLGPEGITVNCICPGPILTGLTERIDPQHREIFAKRRTALRRYGRPEEVAHMTLSLCLPAASYITGAVIPVDGGLTARNA